jgi:glycosyltransferase involved in cell wall biosynthesis
MNNVVIVGIVGIPGRYGGFETLAENLALFRKKQAVPCNLAVYCTTKGIVERPASYLGAELRYIRLNANGVASIAYDFLALLSSMWHRDNIVLMLGVSGAIALPLVRLVSSTRIVVNIDGVEWKRAKWRGVARRFLHFSERVAVRFAHEVIADNASIADYVRATYNVECTVIAYGGDHAVAVADAAIDELQLPQRYAFSVCRIEPENNCHLILEAFAGMASVAIVMVGNWNNNPYGRELHARYCRLPNIHLLDPIYELEKLKTLRSGAEIFVHGHSAGGTNPSLVEAMHFGKPVFAFDCEFNRSTTENKADYFSDVVELNELIGARNPSIAVNGAAMLEIAQRRYRWDVVANAYFDLLFNKAR